MSNDTISPEAATTGTASQEERLYASACHFAGLPVFAVVVLANILAPLIIWLVKRETMPLVNEHGKESLNFQITVMIAYAVAVATFCLGIGVVLIGVIAVLHVIFPIIGGIAAYDGKPYHYPLTLRLIQ